MGVSLGGTINVYMPYYDPSTGAISYVELPQAYILDDGGVYDTRENIITQLSWQNKANSDWLLLYNLSSGIVESGVTGLLSLSLMNAGSAEIIITAGSSLADRWWGTAQIGKFCALQWTQSGFAMPIEFGNQIENQFNVFDVHTTGANFIILPGMTAEVGLAAHIEMPPIYVDEGGGPFVVNYPKSFYP